MITPKFHINIESLIACLKKLRILSNIRIDDSILRTKMHSLRKPKFITFCHNFALQKRKTGALIRPGYESGTYHGHRLVCVFQTLSQVPMKPNTSRRTLGVVQNRQIHLLPWESIAGLSVTAVFVLLQSPSAEFGCNVQPTLGSLPRDAC